MEPRGKANMGEFVRGKRGTKSIENGEGGKKDVTESRFWAWGQGTELGAKGLGGKKKKVTATG